MFCLAGERCRPSVSAIVSGDQGGFWEPEPKNAVQRRSRKWLVYFISREEGFEHEATRFSVVPFGCREMTKTGKLNQL